MPLAQGDRLGHYAIVSLIGTGGMGEVYKARDTRLDRTVALKLLPLEMSSVADRRRRFVQEAKAASALNHPNIAHIYEIGEDGERLYLAMEYVEGETLYERIAAKHFSASEVIGIGAQIAAALAEAHGKRIVHRDIKPANVMITPQGLVKVLDFGLAKIAAPAVEQDDPTLMRTTPGLVMGTIEYMSPEQSRGGEVDHRSDIYSFGLVLHEMATGKLPDALSGGNSRLTPALSRILQRCLDRDRERRWQAASEVEQALRAVQTTAEQPQRSRRWWVAASVAGAVGVGGALWTVLRPGELISSLAVLPLANHSGNADMEYLGEGIAQSLINSLSQLPGLKVKSLVSVAKHKGKLIEPQELGKSLAVQAVVTGSVLQRGDDLAIAVQLVDARNGDQMWGDRYERKLTNLVAMQDEMAREIAGRLRQRLSGDQQKKTAKRYSENTEAYQAYLRGRHYCNKRTEEGIRKGIASFQEAIDKDPGYAIAYSGLADAHMLMVRYGAAQSREHYPQAAVLIRKSLEMDDALAEGHASLAYYKVNFEFDWKGAEEEYRKSIALNPSYAHARLQFATACLAPLERLEEAEREMRRAVELEPLTSVMSTNLGRVFYYRGNWDQAIEAFKKTLELDPGFGEALLWLGKTYFAKGAAVEAIQTLRSARRVRGGSTDLGALGFVLASTGSIDESKGILAELQARPSFNPVDAATIQTGMGQHKVALDLLEKAFEARWAMVSMIKIDPAYRALRAEARFRALMQRMGLPS